MKKCHIAGLTPGDPDDLLTYWLIPGDPYNYNNIDPDVTCIKIFNPTVNLHEINNILSN